MKKIKKLQKKIIFKINSLIFSPILLLNIFRIDVFSVNEENIKIKASTDAGFLESLKKVQSTYGFYFNVFIGACILLSLAVLLIHLIKLGMVGGNPQERKIVLNNMFISLICFSMISGGAVIYYLLFFLF
ncbi:hypothetical protein NBN67_18935 [Clostridioides difficile]|uniref:hypothetical protein n=1 Tax=Clostridioides difficile TaxID=1496 RepID=UPI00202F23D9|nr:hypothetical protein [Clostridioides difficile]ELX4552760.1 hypothetical protein [Clostridioides difficile]MCM0739612.1 hypothetical protein [Clostridioides difficile]HBF2930722.1 hypothetical protein [Clostridioides difficile]HBF2935707.1 hypothetical protein [Clostridioides difficile]HBZ0282902.1 hypothetical protein [Clostridioides difficile]